MDRETFQGFYEATAPSLRAYLRMACRSQSLADDLLHETYLRLLQRRLPELDPVRLKAYLYRTARSVLADHYRTRRRETRFRETLASPDDTRRQDAGKPLGHGDGAAVDPDELPLDMQRVFDSLNRRQRTLLWLAYVEGFKHDEIAEIVGVNSGSVRVLLYRARAELAAKLDAQGLAPHTARGARK